MAVLRFTGSRLVSRVDGVTTTDSPITHLMPSGVTVVNEYGAGTAVHSTVYCTDGQAAEVRAVAQSAGMVEV